MLKLTERPMPKGNPKMASEVIMITPEIAKAWLDQNTGNRKMSTKVSHAYARDMKMKRWKLTGDAIRFDKNNRLIDGQHRLMACVAAETPFESLVIYGLDPTTQDHIDSGKARRVADMLTLRGLHNTSHLAGAVRLLNAQRVGGHGVGGQYGVTHAEASSIIAKHPALSASVREAMGAVGPPIFALAYVHYVGFHILGLPERADAFIRVFKTGTPDYKGCAAHKLRERLLHRRAGNELVKRERVVLALFHTWNLFAKRKPLELLRWPKEAQIDGLDPKCL